MKKQAIGPSKEQHMKHNRSWKRTAWLAPVILVPAIVAACTRSSDPAEDVGEVQQADFVNGGFENGTALAQPPAPWMVTSYQNGGINPTTPQTRAGLNLQSGGNPLLTLTLDSPTGPGTQSDPDLGA